VSQEPIHIPSAAVSHSDDTEDDESALLVTRLMQTGTNHGSRHISPRAGAATLGTGSALKTLSDSVQLGSSRVVDCVPPERGSLDSLHQLTLLVLVSMFYDMFMFSLFKDT